MTEKSFFWNGSSVGDAGTWVVDGGYQMGNSLYESPWEIMLRAIFNGTGDKGVLRDWLNDLAVTGVATPVSVNTGAAIIYGLYYENDSAKTVAIATPSFDIRIDRIVIRRSWADQTARITLLTGVEGAAPPSIVQNPMPGGTGYYDIPIAQISTTTGGVITVIDERDYCAFSTRPIEDSIATVHITDESITFPKREATNKSLFFGGGDLQETVDPPGGYFFGNTHFLHTDRASTGWGSNAATEEGWQVSGSDGAYPYFALGPQFQTTFRLPADYAGGNAQIYTWWMDDSGAAMSSWWNTYWQRWKPNQVNNSYSGDFSDYGEGWGHTEIDETQAVGYLGRSIGGFIGASYLETEYLYSVGVEWTNLAGADRLILHGIEIEYLGYV